MGTLCDSEFEFALVIPAQHLGLVQQTLHTCSMDSADKSSPLVSTVTAQQLQLEQTLLHVFDRKSCV